MGKPNWPMTLVMAAAALGNAACGHFANRNPSFRAAKAPAPTVAFQRIQCGEVSAEAAPQIDVLYQERVPSATSRSSSTLETMLCAHVKQDTGEENLLAGARARWKVTPSLSTVVTRAAEATGAGSTFFLLVDEVPACQNEQALVRDGSGRPVGSVETNQRHCAGSGYLGVHALLFSRTGELLFTASEIADRRRRGAIDASFLALMKQVPADFGVPTSTSTPVAE